MTTTGSAMTTTRTHRAGWARLGRLAAVTVVALTLLLGGNAAGVDASTSEAASCANIDREIRNTANQALVAESQGDTVTYGNLVRRLQNLINQEKAIGC